MENKERELLRNYQFLLNHVEECSICRRKIEKILQHMIDTMKEKSSREALEMLGVKRNGSFKRKDSG